MDVFTLQKKAADGIAATDLEDKTGESMIQCTYRIKDAKDIGWFVCQLEAGHEATTPHRPPRPLGRDPEVEGIWHRPGEKSTADPQPHIPFLGANS
jgi:hypothetical protein